MTRGLFLLPLLLCIYSVHTVDSGSHFTNEWAVEIKGGPDRAKRVAEEHGYEVLHELRGFDDHYLLRHVSVPHRSKRSADHHTRRLSGDGRVQWAEQQEAKIRTKRGYQEEVKREEDRIYREIQMNDPFFGQEWYLKDLRSDTSDDKLDLHVIPVWNANITGKGVSVCILDDGIEKDHDDLKDNYDPYASYDLNGKDSDPSPRLDPTNENKHGTRCAGEVAMAANNGICGVGIAFNAKIGGIRMLDGTVTDALEGQAIMHNHTHVDIYSASWGPNDDGHTVEGPGKLAKQAFVKGITEGRNGKGVIYVWASGNGGRLMDNCDCDGYTGSIYTISVSSASMRFMQPWYGERCASTMATTYSSGSGGDKKVVSTDLRNKCTNLHTGTSAAAPMAAGIFALLLEANPNLTWRDVQHLVAWTSQYAPLMNNKGWKMNAAGFLRNTAFGFGMLDAAGLVKAAKDWKTVPESYECKVVHDRRSNLPRKLETVSGAKMLEIEIGTSGCEEQVNEIRYLEHVVVTISVDYTRRGDLALYLVSPSGTKTMLLSRRDFDKSKDGYQNWGLMSVHTWGEDPRGTWKLIFEDTSKHQNRGMVKKVDLTMYGTREPPAHMAKGPRTYNVEYNEVKDEKKDEGEPERPEGASIMSEVLNKLKMKLKLQQLLGKLHQ